MQSVSIIGIGRLGGALALALANAGYRIENLVYRSRSIAVEISERISPSPQLISFDDLDDLNSDVIFITSADPEIGLISSQIAAKVKRNSLAFHASGSLSSEILSDLAEAGCGTGSMHPLVSISNPMRGSERFAGAYFCVEGRDDAVAAAKEMIARLGGQSFSIDTRFKSLYHASAVTASGHLVALIDIAVEMLSKCGIEPGEAKSILMPLIKSTVENLGSQSSEDALTGTFARGDSEAFDRHLNSLTDNVSDEVRQVYLELAGRSLDLAERHGSAADGHQKIRNGIKLALLRGK